jgi:glycerophosphoryl diester phosphodiesterase
MPLRRTRRVAGAGTAGLDIALLRERPEIVQERHEAGNDVWVWTVDEEDDMRLCRSLGVDAIISNRPAAVLDLLGRNQ